MSDSRRNLLVILLATALQSVAFGVYETSLPLFLEHLGISLISMGVIFGISQVGMLGVRFLVGSKSDAHGRKPFYTASLGLSAATLGLLPLFPYSVVIAVVKTLRDMAGVMHDVVRSVAVYEQAGARFIRWIGRVDGSIFIFMAVGAVSAGALITGVGYTVTFISAGLFSLLAFVVILKGYQETAKHVPAAAQRASLREILKFDLPPELWIIAVSNFVINLGVASSHSFYMLLFFKDKFGFSIPALGTIQMLHRFSLGIPIIFAAHLMDNERLRKHYRTLFITAIAAQGLCLSSSALIPSAILATAIFLLHDIVGATVWTPINAMFIQTRARNDRRGHDVALVTGISAIGFILGPLLAGFLAGNLGWRDGPFFMSGVISIIGGLLMFRLKTVTPEMLRAESDTETS